MGFRSDIIFLLTFLFCVTGEAKTIHLGSSLPPTPWLSPSGIFAFGFYQQDGGNMVGIWLVKTKTIVWTANRDDPPVTANSTLGLNKEGKLVVRSNEQGGGEKLIANTTGSAASVSMLDSGNFVLYNKDSRVIWQSFDYPTDTLLGGQTLKTDKMLVSSLSNTDHSTGRFTLIMQGDGNLVSYSRSGEVTAPASYWASDDSWNKLPSSLYLNPNGSLAIINSSSWETIQMFFNFSTSADYNKSISKSTDTIYCATLDSGGVFRFYFHAFLSSVEPQISVGWKRPENPCTVKGWCGLNSFCTFYDDQPSCRCLPGTNFIDANQILLGCGRISSQETCGGSRVENPASINITTMENMSLGDDNYVVEIISKEDCKKSCLEDCNCGAALYMAKDMDGSCSKYSLPLKYVRRDASATSPSTAFIKLGINSDNGTVPRSVEPPLPLVVVKSRKAVTLILIITISLLTSSCAALAISGLFAYKIRILRYQRLLEYGKLGISEEISLQFFSYNELRKATNGFKEELGKGSFGAVFKGTLNKGKKIIAVKRLEKVVQEGEREFLAEVRAIGRTSHRNLVRLLGYCIEESNRLLVYQYMGNGSLADLLFNSTRRPDWSERVRIALNVARGILYLHEECEAPIIHCDIKPQNILMDEFWTAKISDFGLSKLLMPDQTRTFTGVRGTRGYVAPEWFKKKPVSVKVDIYSFGIVLLEIVCCRRNLEINVSNPEEMVLPDWVYKCFVGRELNKLVGHEEIDKNNLENMVKVGLWCIQDEPALRPSMKSVVLMLEGITDVAIPPCPITDSM